MRKALNKLSILLITFYQRALSPFLGQNCRFQPTCSAYAKEAFQKHSFFKALKLTARRISRCHPWNKGGYDPVPKDNKDKD